MKHNIDKGFTLIEVLLAMALVTFGSVIATKLAVSVLSSNHASEARMETTAIVQSVLNAASATLMSGVAVPSQTAASATAKGDILFDITTTILKTSTTSFNATLNEVLVEVSVYHPGATKNKVTAKTIVVQVIPPP